MLTDVDTEREVRSVKSLTSLKNYGIEYNICINKRYTDLPPAETCAWPEKISFEPGGRLTPAHYGCYLAHKDAFYKGIKSGSDFVFIFECDCIIDIPIESFIEKIELACNILEKNEILMFSFGFHNNVHVIDKLENYWTVNKFYGAHAYLIPKKSYEIMKTMYDTAKWHVTDLLFAENLNQYKIGIFPNPPTKQAGGYSILDKIENPDRY